MFSKAVALSLAAAVAAQKGHPAIPPYPVTYQMNRSTIIMPYVRHISDTPNPSQSLAEPSNAARYVWLQTGVLGAAHLAGVPVSTPASRPCAAVAL